MMLARLADLGLVSEGTMNSNIQEAIDTLEASKYKIDPSKWKEVVKNNMRRECNKVLDKAIKQLQGVK